MRAILATLLVLLFTPVATAHDEGVGYDPAAAAGLFPDPDGVQNAILAAQGTAGITIHDLGESSEGKPIRMLEVTNPTSLVPMHERVVTLIMTQQHGNEPAGTPAAVNLISELISEAGDWEYLENQILLLLPQMNPDGSAAVQRANAQGTDINRDHVALTTPEARILHQILIDWDVHLAMDHHEYGGVGLGYPSPVHIYDYDLTTMFPNHGNVRSPTADMAQELNYDYIYPHVRADGYSISDYGWTTLGIADQDPIKLTQTAGGPDPGILRNNYGLNNVVGLLVESFVHPAENPLASFERRVGSHASVMDAVLAFGHERADDLRETKRESERLNRENPLGQYVEGETSASVHAIYETDDDLRNLWTFHGLPTPVDGANGWLYHADHGRAGLVHALLNPSSSRSVADGHGASESFAHAQQMHRDYSGPNPGAPELIIDREPAQTTPMPVAALLAGLTLVALTRRK